MAHLDPAFRNLRRRFVCEVGDTPDGDGSAVYDTSGRYRYHLSRVWDPAGGRLLFVMLNPSTATAMQLDPTVARTVRWARTWGFGSVEVVNIFALRSTDPAALRRCDDPIGKDNDAAIVAAARRAEVCVAAWGVHGDLRGRGMTVRHLLADVPVEPMVLGLTKDGHPRHPLYLRSDVVPISWPH